MSTVSSKRSLSMILKGQSQLYDLHTHLLGNGNVGFWIDTILMDVYIMPTNDTFRNEKKTRRDLCPLIWDKEGDTGFVDGEEAADFLHYLINNNILPTKDLAGVIKKQLEEKQFSPILWKLIDEKLNGDLNHGCLSFKEDFSYDVVLKLSDLGKGLGIKQMDCKDFVQVAVTEKLGGYLSKPTLRFQHWIIFNAREQKFEVAYGIQVEELRKLITVSPNAPDKARELARAHVINAFSMCDAQGTPARPVDFHSFHGAFTPDFYPRRFALKDSIYSQRLDVLATLIAYIIERYQTCLPPVKYCELSVGVNDLSCPWIYDVLRSVRIYDQVAINRSKKDEESHIYKADNELSSFSQMVLKNYFPHLQVAFKGALYTISEDVASNIPNVTYKFLAGFNRQHIKSPFPNNQDQALRLLYIAPHEAILLMIQEIIKSKNETDNVETDANQQEGFTPCLEQLKRLESMSEKMPSFYNWVVGLDLFGDEMGYPYCPFVARPFIKFINSRREEKGNKHFGVRIHCGENVTFADDDSPVYRLFIAHMYIIFYCLRFLQQELKYGIRIGHGIAFDRTLGASMSPSRYRKSSVLLAEMRNHAHYLFKTIAFEVNITSNEYLLGQTIRQGDFAQILRLNALFDLKAPIILATDDDGIWPIEQCSSFHPGHQSLSAEYCRAISTSLINSEEDLISILKTTKNFCFWNMGGEIQEPLVEDALPAVDSLLNTVIIHPDIIRLIHCRYEEKTREINSAFQRFKIYSEKRKRSTNTITWTNEYGALRVAFICVCANHEGCDEKKKEEIRDEYYELFGTDSNSSEFNFIYENWRRIRSAFVIFNVNNVHAHTGHYVRMQQRDQELQNQECHEIYSTPRDASLMQSQHGPLAHYVQHKRWEKITIHAYAPNMDFDAIKKAFEKQVDKTDDTNPYRDMTLLIFTNTDKHTYTYSKLDNQFILQVNPNPMKRDIMNENFLYALCHHASAATAALHWISTQISDSPRDNIVLSSDTASLLIFSSMSEPVTVPPPAIRPNDIEIQKENIS